MRFSPAVKALIAQIGGWGVVVLISHTIGLAGATVFGFWQIVAFQAAAAAGIAALLRSAPWWLPIHLLFTPLLVAAQTLSLSPLWYLATFILLILTYWNSFRTQVPLFLSGHTAVQAIAAILAERRQSHLLDIGSGIGSVLLPLARQFPEYRFTGIENAPGPLWLGRWRSRKLPNVHIIGGDLFAIPWSPYDILYAFLSPVPMEAVWRKAVHEMKPGTLLISNSFSIDCAVPERIIPLSGGNALFLYRL